jgi:Ca-activated chloride channel family protein
VRVAILLDNGIGSADRIVNVRTGAKGLIEALPEGVEISLHTLAPQPRVLVRPTTDRKSLVEGVDRYSPDSGASRFIEGLIEAVARFDKEKANTFPVVIILGSLTAEGSSIRDRDVKQLFERLQSRAITVHAVLAGASTVSTGGTVANATQIALAATKQTGGRYESIAAATRLATLLPEIGAQVARSHARQSAQYRVTFERPAGKSGNIGQIGLAARSGVTVNLTLDGRLP